MQCLPIKELGKCIFDSSYVEEDICTKSLEKKEVKDFSKEFFSAEYNLESVVTKTSFYYNENIDLYKNPYADLSIQPPNA